MFQPLHFVCLVVMLGRSIYIMAITYLTQIVHTSHKSHIPHTNHALHTCNTLHTLHTLHIPTTLTKLKQIYIHTRTQPCTTLSIVSYFFLHFVFVCLCVGMIVYYATPICFASRSPNFQWFIYDKVMVLARKLIIELTDRCTIAQATRSNVTGCHNRTIPCISCLKRYKFILLTIKYIVRTCLNYKGRPFVNCTDVATGATDECLAFLVRPAGCPLHNAVYQACHLPTPSPPVTASITQICLCWHNYDTP